jgi:hypothetical protein
MVKITGRLVFCALILIKSTAVFAGDFNPEEVTFTQMKTIKTWVASKYLQDENLMKNIQEQISLNIGRNEKSSNYSIETRNDEGVIQVFGYNNMVQADVELAFLQFVHELSKHKRPITLEIAAGSGAFSWKPFLAYNDMGTHYANEFSHTMMKHEFAEKIKQHATALQLDISSSIVKLPGSCFNILNEHPELKNKFDAIYVANLEQFFNPEQHQLFLTLLEDLLAPGGQAFLCANSCGWSGNYSFDKVMPLHSLTTTIYPCFIQSFVAFNKNKSRVFEAEMCAVENVNTSHVLVQKNSDDMIEFSGAKLYADSIYSHASNGFSPEIYRRAIGPHPALQMIDSFFVDYSGVRTDKVDKAERVVAIIKKLDNK